MSPTDMEAPAGHHDRLDVDALYRQCHVRLVAHVRHHYRGADADDVAHDAMGTRQHPDRYPRWAGRRRARKRQHWPGYSLPSHRRLQNRQGIHAIGGSSRLSAEELEEHEAARELALYREYRDVALPVHPSLWRRSGGSTWPTRWTCRSATRTARCTSRCRWPTRVGVGHAPTNVRVITFKDVHVDELDKLDDIGRELNR